MKRGAQLSLGTVMLQHLHGILVASQRDDKESFDLSREIKVFAAIGMKHHLERRKAFMDAWRKYLTAKCPEGRIPTDWAFEQDLHMLSEICGIYEADGLLAPKPTPDDTPGSEDDEGVLA